MDAVLDEIEARPAVDRLVIGIRRRSPVGKALLGSVSQRLLLESPVSLSSRSNHRLDRASASGGTSARRRGPSRCRGDR
ncbi:universal stress protein [Streptomyces sp. PSAA01]|uniref:universal stress protein n=1 Tax=Streptomyces sp. PSAA01 TaxID=2912762 RepID=UPI0035AB7950